MDQVQIHIIRFQLLQRALRALLNGIWMVHGPPDLLENNKYFYFEFELGHMDFGVNSFFKNF